MFLFSSLAHVRRTNTFGDSMLSQKHNVTIGLQNKERNSYEINIFQLSECTRYNNNKKKYMCWSRLLINVNFK